MMNCLDHLNTHFQLEILTSTQNFLRQKQPIQSPFHSDNIVEEQGSFFSILIKILFNRDFKGTLIQI